ncbi:MAG: tol-pal system-associated acyl-CoA thioesterase [Arenimonas sp.]
MPPTCSAVERVFSFQHRVYWEDTDAGGVVYHASYLCFLERARTEWLRAHGVEQHGMRESQDLVMAVRSLQVEFQAPARLDDLLESRLRLSERRGASFSLAQELWRGSECLLHAEVQIACLRASSFRPRALPPWLVAAIGAPARIRTENMPGDTP